MTIRALLMAAILIAGHGALQEFPPISWSCPMHPDVVDDRPGRCPVCNMALEPVRLDRVWSCPVHAAVTGSNPGRCPICQRELMPVTMSLSWTCPEQPAVRQLKPGVCPSGLSAQVKYTPRPHGNHNPQHGGQFFMAPDNWHHLEGVYDGKGRFQLYVYDDYSRPLSTEQLRTVTGHVTVAGREAPLRMRPALEPLEADIRPASLPMEVAAHVRFTPDSPEYRFDFTYGGTATTESAGAATHSSRAAASAPLADLRARVDEIRATIDRGAFTEVYVPAFAAKDLALAIAARDSRTNTVVARLVRAAWMLDAAADVGDRGQVRDAYTRLTKAVDELEALVK